MEFLMFSGVNMIQNEILAFGCSLAVFDHPCPAEEFSRISAHVLNYAARNSIIRSSSFEEGCRGGGLKAKNNSCPPIRNMIYL
jgi:hypothetical protein